VPPFSLQSLGTRAESLGQHRNLRFINPIKLTFKPALNDLAPEIAGRNMHATGVPFAFVQDLSRKYE
jgi:hypothetical protein